MLNRRSFVAALAGLPFAGKLFASDAPVFERVDYTPDIELAGYPKHVVVEVAFMTFAREGMTGKFTWLSVPAKEIEPGCFVANFSGLIPKDGQVKLTVAESGAMMIALPDESPRPANSPADRGR